MKSSIGKITDALELAKLAEVGCTLTYFDVIELLGYMRSMEEDAALSGLFPPGEMTPPDGGPMCTCSDNPFTGSKRK